jgi:hypothetical protein
MENETMENRAEKRHAKSAPVIFSPFSTQNWCPNHAEVGNFSTSGMFFKSSRPLTRGSTIHFRIEMDASSEEDRNHASAQLRTVTLAQVKWCKPVIENSRNCFGVGVRYL